MKSFLAASARLLATAACGGAAATAIPLPVPIAAPAPTPELDVTGSGAAAPFALGATAFSDAGLIPDRYTCESEDISPGLFWGGAPQDTESFVVVVDDPDAPGKVWHHWVVFNIPATTLSLEEDQPDTDQLPGAEASTARTAGETPHT